MTILVYITPKDFVRLDHKNSYKLPLIILLGLCEKEKYMRVWLGEGDALYLLV
jgi:hypothetical protein